MIIRLCFFSICAQQTVIPQDYVTSLEVIVFSHHGLSLAAGLFGSNRGGSETQKRKSRSQIRKLEWNIVEIKPREEEGEETEVLSIKQEASSCGVRICWRETVGNFISKTHDGELFPGKFMGSKTIERIG